MRHLNKRGASQLLAFKWDERLLKNVASKLRELRKDGTTDIGFECLLQHTSLIPKQAGGPVGGNLQWQYRNRLADACWALHPDLRRMVMDIPAST